ncbi:Fic family protein [Dickeya dadantii]|nr:Fic family protein [Dickeya dadantii]
MPTHIKILLKDTKIKKGIRISLMDYRLVHIKKTKNKKRTVNYYWNNRTKEIICGSGGLSKSKKIPSISHILKYKEETCNLSRKEIQLGDSVCVLFNATAADFIFGTIVGFDKIGREKYFHILPHSKDFPFKKGAVIKVKYDKNKFILLKDGVNERYEKMSTKNLVFAKYQYQVDFAELIISYINTYNLISSYMIDKRKKINESTIIECHKALFGKIYDWAGSYRSHEVVVGDRERPTIEHADIKTSLKKSLRQCQENELAKIKNRNDLINKIVVLHAELAWIHPFQDGNGRTIRLFLQIISATMGYNLNIEEIDGSLKKKKAYHYAVRRAIHNRKNNLIALISRAINEF